MVILFQERYARNLKETKPQTIYNCHGEEEKSQNIFLSTIRVRGAYSAHLTKFTIFQEIIHNEHFISLVVNSSLSIVVIIQ